jgi:hypothetical protein
MQRYLPAPKFVALPCGWSMTSRERRILIPLIIGTPDGMYEIAESRADSGYESPELVDYLSILQVVWEGRIPSFECLVELESPHMEATVDPPFERIRTQRMVREEEEEGNVNLIQTVGRSRFQFLLHVRSFPKKVSTRSRHVQNSTSGLELYLFPTFCRSAISSVGYIDENQSIDTALYRGCGTARRRTAIEREITCSQVCD